MSDQLHIAEIKLHRAWNEYRADCSCGHVGSYVKTVKAAKTDHLRHVEQIAHEHQSGSM